jgi:hypothetical protein
MNPEEQIDLSKPARQHLFKYFSTFLLIMLVIFVSLFGLSKYQRYLGASEVEKVADALERLKQQDYEDAMADTVGGKTPQETLSLYIQALEKRDFVLAGKYFIGTKQQEETDSWKGIPENRIKDVIVILKSSLKSELDCSTDRKQCVIHDPVLVDFKLYPNGIWKIIEI